MRCWIALLLSLLLMPTAARADCPSLWPASTFLQLYEADLEREADDWREALAHWRKLGVEDLILQWSAYGAPDRGPFPLIESGTISRLLDAAEGNAMRLWIGLRYDPGFWAEHSHDESSLADEGLQAPSNLSRYLFRRWQDQQALADALAPLAAHRAFGGWYISDEIDDQRWRTTGRRQLLTAYLQQLAALLKNQHPQAPVAISAFSNGLLPPLELAEYLQKLMTDSGIDQLLFQDGIGAGKLEMSELGYYLPVLSEQLAEAGHSFKVIVELFEAAEGPEAFAAAPMNRVTQQLHHAAAYAPALATFALPHHADPAAGEAAARLAGEVARLKARCGF